MFDRLFDDKSVFGTLPQYEGVRVLASGRIQKPTYSIAA
jgi:hypothetical protein